MKTKPTNIIQRLCLFLFVFVLAAPAWATDYGRLDYETFRSRKTVNAVGKKKPVRTLRQGRVEIKFSNCNTTGGTGSDAIYELAKGSRINVEVDDGYAIRWIILRDTEGGESYTSPMVSSASAGLHRAISVTSRGMPSQIRKYLEAIRMNSTTTTTTSSSSSMMPRHEASTSGLTTIPVGDSSRCATSLWGMSGYPT